MYLCKTELFMMHCNTWNYFTYQNELFEIELYGRLTVCKQKTVLKPMADCV